MNGYFVWHYAGALAMTAALLAAVFFMARVSERIRRGSKGHGRAIRIVESTMLSPGTMLHVVRMGESCYLLGGGSGRLTVIDKIVDTSACTATSGG